MCTLTIRLQLSRHKSMCEEKRRRGGKISMEFAIVWCPSRTGSLGSTILFDITKHPIPNNQHSSSCRLSTTIMAASATTLVSKDVIQGFTAAQRASVPSDAFAATAAAACAVLTGLNPKAESKLWGMANHHLATLITASLTLHTHTPVSTHLQRVVL